MVLKKRFYQLFMIHLFQHDHQIEKQKTTQSQRGINKQFINLEQFQKLQCNIPLVRVSN
jgi:hypothetical protein